MSRREKLIQRLKSSPKDFTFEELTTLMKYFGYELDNSGKTSGSRARFVKKGKGTYFLHKPHAYKGLLEYQIKRIIDFLEGEGLL